GRGESPRRPASLPWRSQRLGGVEHFGSVAFDFHLAPDAGNSPFGIDQVGGAVHAHELAAVKLLFAPDAQRIGQPLLAIGGERNRKAVLGGEFGVLGRRILADPEDGSAGLLELGKQIRKVLALDRAAGRVVLRVEEQYLLAAAEVGRADGAALGRLQRDVGKGVADVGRLAHESISSFSPKVSAQTAAIPWRASASACKSAG